MGLGQAIVRIGLSIGWVLTMSATLSAQTDSADTIAARIAEIERPRILAKADQYLDESPRTVTADVCERSAGGPHDFYSEGDYWWPNPKDPDGPYIRRDGESNPENFIAHRQAMIRLSEIVGALTSAYVLTEDERYAAAAVQHMQAWFIDEATRMNPHLLYAQAIKGRHTGRGIGVIDTIHLTEVALAAKVLARAEAFSQQDQQAVRQWFRNYLDWLTEHPYGLAEKAEDNNHGVCWSMQAAAFALLVEDEELLAWIRQNFKENLLVNQMGPDGSFAKELGRTKPYGYSLFVIDAMAGVAQIASTPEDDLWTYESEDGQSMSRGLKYIAPFIKDKSGWPLPPDVAYHDKWPVRQPCLVLGALHLDRPDLLETWARLEADPTTYEVLRNLPLRHPLVWLAATGDKRVPAAQDNPCGSCGDHCDHVISGAGHRLPQQR